MAIPKVKLLISVKISNKEIRNIILKSSWKIFSLNFNNTSMNKSIMNNLVEYIGLIKSRDEKDKITR